jgi:hypothetical protein
VIPGMNQHVASLAVPTKNGVVTSRPAEANRSTPGRIAPDARIALLKNRPSDHGPVQTAHNSRLYCRELQPFISLRVFPSHVTLGARDLEEFV